MIKRIIIPALVIIVVVAAGLTWYVTRLPSSPFDGAEQSADFSDELITRGEYVARAADCVACHSVPGQEPFTGGLEMASAIGSMYTTNITPDEETGIGGWSLADFDRAVRHGVLPDRKRIYPSMPYPSYATMTDDDIEALYAYFMQEVEAVERENRSTDIPYPLNIRWPLALWNTVFATNSTYETVADQDEMWNRGAYLVQGAGHCGSCHTPRGLAIQEKALDDSDPIYLSGALLDGWYAPSLRNDHNTGLGRWTEEQVVEFLKEGRNEHAVVFGSMADAFNNSTQFLTDEDLQAIAHYLKSLPGDPARDGTPWEYDAATNEQLTLANRGDVPGAQTFMARCASCHGADGRGQTPWIPPLAGSAASLADEDASSINVTLNGSARTVANGMPDAYRMPPFRNQLSDQEIADVLSFVRTGWGNTGGEVTAEDVGELRERTDPAGPDPIILQMR